MATADSSPSRIPDAEHTVVYRDDDEFCSWPFNVGMWRIADDDILVAFIRCECDYSVPGNLTHRRVETYGEIYSMRTRDGGETWEDAGVIAHNPTTSDEARYGADPDPDPVDLTDPETLLTCWSAPNSAVNPTGWIKVSENGGRTWGPTRALPSFIFDRIQGRPSYVVRPDGAILLTLTGRSENDPHDRSVAYVSFDGGVNWTFVGYIAGSDDYRMICPSPVVLDDGRIVAAVRCKPKSQANWVEVYESEDGGRRWSYLSRVNDHGEPGHLIRLDDGRLLCVYGYRHPPYGIRARVSDDGGRSWGREWILRDDGGVYDLGYPRAAEVEDGRVVVAYYFNEDEPDCPADGGVRHIAATTFDVPEVE